MRTIAIINQKGGCGKTTSAINLAGLLARAGRRTLLIDMDPQSHCAAGLGVPEHRIDLDIGDAMLAVGVRAIDASRLLWCTGRNLDLAPSRMKLAGLEAAKGGLSDLPDKDRRLAHVLGELRASYEIAIIDCSPAIGLLTYNALIAADLVLIPVETSFFSLQGATKQVNTVKSIGRRLGITRPVWLLPTIHDETSAVACDLLSELKRRFKERLVPVTIRRDNKLKEAASFGQSIVDYAPGSEGAEDYTRLSEWILDQLSTMKTDAAGAEPTLAPDAMAAGDADEPAIVEVIARDADAVLPRRSEALAKLAATLAGSGVGAADAAPAVSAPPAGIVAAPQAAAPHTEPKSLPGSRAEDVARRAQQFLRRALGHVTGAAPKPGTTHPQPTASTTATVSPPDAPTLGHMGEAPMLPEPTLPVVTRMSELIESAAGTHPTLRIVESAPPEPVSRATQRFLGATWTSSGVLFVQPLTAGRHVCVAGDFNSWNATSHAMRRNESLGVFELSVKLPEGPNRYRLVVDGRWAADPYNACTELNPYGEPNNVIVVPGESGVRHSA